MICAVRAFAHIGTQDTIQEKKKEEICEDDGDQNDQNPATATAAFSCILNMLHSFRYAKENECKT